MKLHIEFTDANQTEIKSIFASPQSIEDHPFYAEIDSSDERYANYYHSLPEYMQQGLVTPTNA
ncbi:hypothetical protein [Yersinia frederiksenii]|uniref:hypothetical protein n=1 Tax=Yersinia frederiksenii TaxID=29484 RepID=UPI0005DE12A4|nr:hypothetical protein [Yersinia frederiksenii]CNF53504.1 Uncharacterised protein [Yersinia frederiksenii]CNF59595.1 Uncharacterised protein [Yersinia frederiksenii]